jgi:hypothetical protein
VDQLSRVLNMFLYFTLTDGKSIAINPTHVAAILPSEESDKAVKVVMTNSSWIDLEGDYMEIVSRMGSV